MHRFRGKFVCSYFRTNFSVIVIIFRVLILLAVIFIFLSIHSHNISVFLLLNIFKIALEKHQQITEKSPPQRLLSHNLSFVFLEIPDLSLKFHLDIQKYAIPVACPTCQNVHKVAYLYGIYITQRNTQLWQQPSQTLCNLWWSRIIYLESRKI